MIAHCIDWLPDEGCGILLGEPGSGLVTACILTDNAAKSAKVYEVDSKDLLRADRQARETGTEIIGVFHSHTHTDAYPSPTDVAQAPDPDWHYVLVSLRHPDPAVRSFYIRDGRIEEETVQVIA